MKRLENKTIFKIFSQIRKKKLKFMNSFACQFAIKAAEGYAERLYCTHRVAIVASKHILVYSTKLHNNIFNYKTNDSTFKWELTKN